MGWSDVLGLGQVSGLGSRGYAAGLVQPFHPSISEAETEGAARTSCSHTRVIYVGGEGLGLLNSDMTNRMGMPLISYYGVTLFNL